MPLLIPKIIPKKRYFHKLDFEGESKGNTTLHLGQFGLKTLKGAWISKKQIESARKVLARAVKTYGQIFIRIYPHMPKTKKPVKSTMGSSKGAVESYVSVVKRGTAMFEIKLFDLKYKKAIINALEKSIDKLPIPADKCEISI